MRSSSVVEQRGKPFVAVGSIPAFARFRFLSRVVTGAKFKRWTLTILLSNLNALPTLMQNTHSLGDDLKHLIEYSQHEGYNGFLLIRLVNIYYIRQQQGLSRDSFMYALHITGMKQLRDETAESFLAYLQGVIRVMLMHQKQPVTNKYE